MYKRASRNLQHAHRVDAPLPTGGYIGSEASNDDMIRSAGNMSQRECEEERRTLLLEKTRAQNDMIAAKADDDKDRVQLIGLRIQAFCGRLSLLKRRLHELSRVDEAQAFYAATREMVDPDTFRAIVARKSEIQATLTEGAAA